MTASYDDQLKGNSSMIGLESDVMSGDPSLKRQRPVRGTRFRRPLRTMGFLAIVVMLGATPPAIAQPSAGDPLESFNRGSFEFNLFLDRLLLKPVAKTYRFVTPGFVRAGFSNFLFNLKTPVTVANDLLQGEPLRATESVGRFMFNTILGVGGLVDVGGMLGMPERHAEDFGQTLAVYGVGSGPYIMMPLLGPTNPRDLAGLVVDFAFDPLTFLGPTEVGLARRGATIVSFREQNIETLDELERTSIDFYAATRTLAQQFRQNEIRNGAPPPLDDAYGEDIYDESIFDEEFDDFEEPEDADEESN